MMIRRSRISVRPNVRPTGRAAPPSREAPQGNDTPADPSNDAGVEAGAQEVVSETGPASTVPVEETNNNNTESQSGDVTSQSDPSVTSTDVTDQSAPSSSLSTRRKRFSVLPNLSKPRVTPASALASSKPPKSPVRTETPPASTRPVSESPDEHESTQEPVPRPLPVSTKSLRSPAPKLPPSSIRNASRASRFPTKAVIPTEATTNDTVTTPELPPAPPAPSDDKTKQRKVKQVTQTEDDAETSSSRSDDAASLSANQDAAESSCPTEPAPGSQSPNEPVVREESDPGSPGKGKKPQHQVPLALRTLNDPVDRLRLARARKLRDLLKKEMSKDKHKEKHQRPQIGVTKHKKPKDHTKMTMRELIYYLPSTNPMKSYTDDEQRAETESPSETESKAAPAVQPAPEEAAAAEEEEEEEEEREGEEEEQPLAPRVKVAEDGSLIIDEESLTVQVHRMKGPNPLEGRDPIFERGSTTTYSSFRKGTYTKPWSNRETDMFFLAISMVGTDFSMIGQLFPHRCRIEIKNKFKKEERANSWRIDKAFKEKRRLDLDFFKKLLEQILKDEEEKRKKKKQTSQMAKIARQTPRERKRKIYSSDSEEEESSSSDTMEGEKENENVCNDGGSGAAPKRKRAGAVKKRSEHANQSAEQEAEDEAESGANEDPSPFNELESVEAETEAERETESFWVKPIQRQRNRRPEAEGKTHTSAKDESTKESASNASAVSVQEKKRRTSDVISCGLQDTESEEEPDLTAIQENILNKPTRSGRIPKLSQHMIRAAADDEDDEEEQQLPPVPRPPVPRPPVPRPPDARPRGSQAKRGRLHAPRRGKSRLLTLRAVPDEEDEEEECGMNQEEENYSASVEEENQAFVPIGLRTVMAFQAEVEETMEELDISVNVPDVLGISQNAVCPESSCARALTPMGSVPCEHQLDLLVDVIEFLAPDHMEVSEEAARTLLTIGHSAHVTQTGDLSGTGDVIIVEESSSQVHEEVLMETTCQSEIRVETCDAVTSEPSPITSETDRLGTDSTGDKTSAPSAPQDPAPTAEPAVSQERQVPPNENEIQSETANAIVQEPPASKARRNRLPKPKPNLSRVSRTAQRQPAESVTSSTETLGTTGTADTTQESQVLTAGDFVPNAQSQPEPEDQSAETCGEREQDRTEGCSPVPSLETETQEGHTGKRTCVADERREEVLHTHSEPSGSECTVKPCQPVRRCRGPKPKPNLVRSVRTTHPVTHVPQNPVAVPDEKVVATTVPDIQQPEEGANVVPEPDRETQCQLPTTTPDADPDEPPSRPACESSASDKPVFILSLTEVLPAHTGGAELDPLTLPAASGSLSEPISAVENAIAVVGDTGPAGDQVFPDALIPFSEDEETEKRGNETSRRADEESPSRLPKEKDCSPLEQNIIAPVGPDEPLGCRASGCHKENVEQAGLAAKRRKLPERARRRAKLQIKPNSVQRKTCRDRPSLDETGSAPASSCEVMLEETEPTSVFVPSVVSAEEPSSSSSSSATLDKNSSTPSVATEQSSVTPPPSARTETPPTLVSSSSSQDSIGNIDLPETEPADTGASVMGAESQPVHQEVPLTSTGTLARPSRRPKGFLSFMSSTSAQRPSESPRTSQKPSVITPRAKRRQAAPSTSATPPPLPPPPPQQEESSHTHAETLTTPSANPSAAEDGEEPTSVSAYFFNDIFTVVDEPEDSE